MYIEYTLNISSEKVDNNGSENDEKHRQEHNSTAHGRCPSLILMEFRKLGRLSDERFLTDLLTETMFVEETDIRRDQEES